jgi:flagellar biosynthesis/type III secretory pathway M-ring protein FliF/YscJ
MQHPPGVLNAGPGHGHPPHAPVPAAPAQIPPPAPALVAQQQQQDHDQDGSAESEEDQQLPDERREPGSAVASWIDRLETPSTPVPDSQDGQDNGSQDVQTNGEAGDDDDDDDEDEETVREAPLNAAAQQGDGNRIPQWFQDPYVRVLMFLALLFFIVVVLWLIWRYVINWVEFEYMDRIRKERYDRRG